jgi:hypothetical protein
MAALRQRPMFRWALETGGEFTGEEAEEVVRLSAGGYAIEEVDPMGLLMGGSQPIRTLRRTA